MKKDNFLHFAKALYRLRGNQSLELLGTRLGLSKGYLCQLEGGSKKPSESFFQIIKERLGVSSAMTLVEEYQKDLQNNLEKNKNEYELLRALSEDSKK